MLPEHIHLKSHFQLDLQKFQISSKSREQQQQNK